MQELIHKISFKRPEKNYDACVTLAQETSIATLKQHTLQYLHIDEKKYLNSLHAESRIFSYCLGRYVCKKAIQGLISTQNLHEIHIEKGVFTQPCPTHLSRKLPQITCSHSAQLAVACAFPNQHPVGIDIEKISKKSAAAIKRCCSSNELNYILDTQEKHLNTPLNLTAIWSIKESLSKAIKTGRMCPFNLLEIQNLKYEKGVWSNTFKNFFQYKCLTWHITVNSIKYTLSMSFPKKSSLFLDVENTNLWTFNTPTHP